jgi:hypothetical protein
MEEKEFIELARRDDLDDDEIQAEITNAKKYKIPLKTVFEIRHEIRGQLRQAFQDPPNRCSQNKTAPS